MRTSRWGMSLIGVALLCISVGADELEAEKDVAFWLAPKTSVDLRSLAPAEVTLVAGPDMRRGMILLQTGADAPPVDFVPTIDELKPFLPAQDSGYKIIPKGL